MKPRFTSRQGQYLAFIYHYTKVNGRPPAQADMQQYFRVSPPTIHQMILNLEKRGLLARMPGEPRSLRVLLPPEQLPELVSPAASREKQRANKDTETRPSRDNRKRPAQVPDASASLARLKGEEAAALLRTLLRKHPELTEEVEVLAGSVIGDVSILRAARCWDGRRIPRVRWSVWRWAPCGRFCAGPKGRKTSQHPPVAYRTFSARPRRSRPTCWSGPGAARIESASASRPWQIRARPPRPSAAMTPKSGATTSASATADGNSSAAAMDERKRHALPNLRMRRERPFPVRTGPTDHSQEQPIFTAFLRSCLMATAEAQQAPSNWRVAWIAAGTSFRSIR